jgi:hypothetical protein
MDREADNGVEIMSKRSNPVFQVAKAMEEIHAVNQMIKDQEIRVDDVLRLLLDMVNQYCVGRLDGDGRAVVYRHSFMSTGEEVFDYLVEHGLATRCENGVDIRDLRYPMEKR